jgi:hypothetical protein
MSHIYVSDVLRGFHGPDPRAPDPSAKLVLISLAEHANKKSGGVAWPSVATIAEESDLSVRQVQYHLRELEAAGWLSPVGNTCGGRGRSTRYQLNIARMRAARLAKGEAHCTVSETERVKPTAGNGEAERAKRVKPTAPEPEVNLKEPPAAKAKTQRTQKRKPLPKEREDYRQAIERLETESKPMPTSMAESKAMAVVSDTRTGKASDTKSTTEPERSADARSWAPGERVAALAHCADLKNRLARKPSS